MVAEREIEGIKESILRDLPRVLEKDAQFVLFIEGMLSERFPRRDEFARLLEQVESLRLEQREGFERVDHRFEQVDHRLDGVEQQLESLDQQTGDLRDSLTGQMTDLHDSLTGQMSDLRDSLTGQMSDLRDWVELTVGRLQTRSGRRLEDVVAGALRLGLEQPDIRPENILMRQKIRDPEGLVFRPGKEKEVDLVAKDDELLVFEVQSAPDADDVDEFADKVELLRLQNPDKKVSGVFISLGGDETLQRLCAERGLRLIPSPKALPDES